MNRPLFAAALLASVSLAASAANARPMTPEDVARLQSLGSMAVSPDGSRVAFTTAALPDVTKGEKDGTTKQVLKIATAPDAARAFLPEDISPGGIAFTPDGTMVTFLWAKSDEKRSVWGVPVDGGAYRKLAGLKDANVRSYRFSPDGSTVYMLADAAVDDQRDTQKKAGFDALVYEEELTTARMFAARIGTEHDAAPSQIAVPGHVSAFRLTPDGKAAIIETAPTPLVDDSYTSKRVNVFDLASGKVRAVVETMGKIDDVEIAPDGRQLSLIAGVDQHDPAPTTLYLVDVATGNLRALNEGAAEAAVDAKWLPDGRLAAIIHQGVQSRLRIYNADGSVSAEHNPGELILTSIDAAGARIVLSANSPQHPSELYSFENGQFTRWTRHNPWLSEITFGNQRAYRYTARDGQQIEGVLIEPVGGVPRRGGAPTIMNVHGGPEAHDSNGWQTGYSKPGQVAAGKGYAVFLPNYRGSTGYGVAFAKQHQGDYGGKEFDDIVDAKRALVADGITDAKRTGITGGSYGGYASAWGATYYSSEYAASVMFVGISNNISKFGTTDIPNEMYLVHERKWPWEEWEHLLDRSPIFHVDKATTPILIMHGDSDPRVHPSQSMELYRNIKTRKPAVPLRLVFYPGEGHGNNRAASRYDYNLRMMDWFETYLKTGNRSAALPAARPSLAEGAKGAKPASKTGK
jgi:dipeptidyl aminopeptidase/acylaminoacyl peptidase